MAVLLTNSAEGQVDGTLIGSGANTGGASGEAFAVSKTATATIEFDSAQKAHGTNSYKFTFTGASESGFLQWSTPPLEAAGTYAISFYFFMTAPPAASDQFLASPRRASSGGPEIAVNPAGRLRVLDVNSSNAMTSDTVIPNNTWIRVSVLVTKGTTTTNGSIEVKWYLGDSTTQQGATMASTTYNTGTTDFATVRFGRISALASAFTFWIDDPTAWAGATGHLPPYGSNVAPTVSVAPSQVIQKDATATITWSGSDTDGTIASYSISRTSGPGAAPTLSGTGTTRTATFATPGVHVYSITATDDDGAVSTPVTHTVYVTDTTSRPQTLVSNPGVFLNIGGAASIPAALADESDATYAESPDNPAGAAFTVDFAPLGEGPVTVQTRNASSAATPAISRLIELLQGSTVIASSTVALTTTPTNHSFTTTTGQTATITDRTALRLRITDTAA